MTEFAEKVKERTDGRIQIQIFPNGQLGSENENMEQLMSGVISMTKGCLLLVLQLIMNPTTHSDFLIF